MTTPSFIPWAKPDFWGKEQAYVIEALTSTWISGGAFVDRLEREFVAHFGPPYAVSASNGTTALHMAYLALGLGPGAEIVVPGFAFMAAANVALHIGATPVFADVDPATWCVTAGQIESCLTDRTKAIVPVHTYGNVCDMDDILALASRRGIPVLEDAAESLGSCYKQRQSGTMALLGSFSFQATKTITTGEGGMVVTASEALRDRMALYRNHGMSHTRYWHEVAGHNFRLTNLQAALGCAQMEAWPRIVAARKRVHASYAAHLAGIDGVVPQHFSPDVDPVLWAIAVRLDEQAFPQGRDAVIDQCKHAGIETRPAFRPPSVMPHLYTCPPLPVSEDLGRQVISLPTYPTLDDDQIAFICSTLRSLRAPLARRGGMGARADLA